MSNIIGVEFNGLLVLRSDLIKPSNIFRAVGIEAKPRGKHSNMFPTTPRPIPWILRVNEFKIAYNVYKYHAN